MKTELTQKILQYQETGKNFRECVTHASKIAYYYPQNKYGWELEDCSDFFSEFFPKLKKIIKRFCYNGRPFEVLLIKYIRYNIKTFIRKRKKNIKSTVLLDRNLLWHEPYHTDNYEFEEYCTVSEAGSILLDLNEKGKIKKDTTKKRFLYIVLKNMTRISEKMKKSACRMIDIPESEIDSIMHKLLPKINLRKKRLEHLKGLRNSYLSKIIEIERHNMYIYNIDIRQNNIFKIEKIRKRLRKIIYEISKVNISPTYSEIAEVLDTPKGTIDSGVHNFRNKFYELAEKQCS